MTRTEITAFMADVVEQKMRRFQTDFTDYDKPRVEDCEAKEFPFLWIVSDLHTHMISLGNYEEAFFSSMSTRNAYAKGDDGISFLLDPHFLKSDDRLFLITEDKIWETNVDGARAAIKDYTIPAYEKWKELNGEIKVKRVTVKFDLISLSKLKEIIRDCHNHNDDSLMGIFRGFHKKRCVAEDHTVIVKYAWWDNEFICSDYYNGEVHMIAHVKFHGWPETGYQTNGSIQLDPHYGWSSHT